MPATSVSVTFEPGKMTSQGGRAQHRIGILLELLIWDSFVDRNWIVGSVDREKGNANCQKRIDGGCIAVIGSLSWITPGWSLNFSVEFVQIRDFPHAFHANIWILLDLLGVKLY